MMTRRTGVAFALAASITALSGCVSNDTRDAGKISFSAIKRINITDKQARGVTNSVTMLGDLTSDPDVITVTENAAVTKGEMEPIWYYWAGMFRLSDAWKHPANKEASAAKGRAWLEKGCAAKDLSSCHGLAQELHLARMLPRDDATAKSLWDQNCKAGYLLSCLFVGVDRLNFVQGGRNNAAMSEANDYLKRAAYGGMDEAWHYYRLLIRLKNKAEGKAEEDTQAKLQERCNNQDGEACLMAALALFPEGAKHVAHLEIPKGNDKAAELAEKGCLLSNSLACRLAGKYIIGQIDGQPLNFMASGPVPRLRTGITYLDRSCELGNQKGCAILGTVELGYFFNPPEALIERADHGSLTACHAGLGGACLNQLKKEEKGVEHGRPDHGPRYVAQACAEYEPKACIAYLQYVVTPQVALLKKPAPTP